MGREKGCVGQRCFFAIYHPPIIWAPTVWLGALNAWLFRHTNCLETAIVAHMIYSAALVLWWLPCTSVQKPFRVAWPFSEESSIQSISTACSCMGK